MTGPRALELLAGGVADGAIPAELLGELRAEGLRIDERDGRLWLADPAGFGPSVLEWRCGRPVRFLERCASTNTELLALARDGAPAGTVVVAEHQEGGRGRLGRRWLSRPGLDLTWSVLLRPRLRPGSIPLVCLAAAVGAAEVTGLRIRWPNDLVSEGGVKVGGILAELQGAPPAVVLGVGINVNGLDFPPGLPPASSLAILGGGTLDRAELLGRLLAAIERRCRQLEKDRDGVLDAWRLRSHTLGRRVRVGAVEGVAVALREDGALVVEGEGGREAVLAGDVEMVAAAPVQDGSSKPTGMPSFLEKS